MQRYEQYIGLIVAFVALLVAIYALATQPKPQPAASATVKLADRISVDVPGVYTTTLGWIYVKDAPAVVQLSANYTYIWFLLDGVRYGNPAQAVLQPGNHTVSAVIAVYGNGTKINISYKVVG
jgi:hypothetical protein